MALSAKGRVWTWGANLYGELGNGTYNGSITPQLALIFNVTKICAGTSISVALKSNGTVWTWGTNIQGLLGNGSNMTDSPIPVQVSGLLDVVDISAGGSHVLALKSDGSVWAWGMNWSGQLGNGTGGFFQFMNYPVKVYNLSGAAKIFAGGNFSFAIKKDGTVWAWGDNSSYFGNGNFMGSYIPVQISNLQGLSLAIGRNSHNLAISTNGTAYAWGTNWYGELGNGTNAFLSSSNFPQQILSLSGIVQVSPGSFYSLALRNDGTVWSWGVNWENQLGNGTTTFLSNVPTQVVRDSSGNPLTNIRVISAGYKHSLVIRNDGSVLAWGNNSSGQLGIGNNISSNIPLKVLFP